MKSITFTILMVSLTYLQAEVISARQSSSSHQLPSSTGHIRLTESPSEELRRLADGIGARRCLGGGSREDVAATSNCRSLQAAVLHLHGSRNPDGSRRPCSGTPAPAGGSGADMRHAIACDVFATFLSRTPCDALYDTGKRAQCNALVRGEGGRCGTPNQYDEFDEVTCHSIKNAINGSCPVTPNIERRLLARIICEKYHSLSMETYILRIFP